jgi:hypothetical protein
MMKKKLAGHGSGTALWVTSVKNEYSQVLQCVMTSAESEAGQHEMVTGLMKRYADASIEPPKLLYVDSKCCSFSGTSPFKSDFKNGHNFCFGSIYTTSCGARSLCND